MRVTECTTASRDPSKDFLGKTWNQRYN